MAAEGISADAHPNRLDALVAAYRLDLAGPARARLTAENLAWAERTDPVKRVAQIIGEWLGGSGQLPGVGGHPGLEEWWLETYPNLIAVARGFPMPFLVAIATKEICEGQATNRWLRLPPSRFDAKILAGLRRVLAPAPGRWFVERRVLSSSARRPRGRVGRRARAPGRPSADDPDPLARAADRRAQ
jgi:hypothetical protein